MTSRAIVALGLGQCVNWGVLYYAFGVILVPVSHDLGVPRWVVAGAFSTALVTSAAVAPTIGRWSDRGRGPLLIQGGGFLAAALLITWALLPGVAMLYLVWAGLGLCMAATLYEPAFAVVGRALSNPGDRLRALAAVTVFGGLASTVFLPLTAVLTQSWGWRAGVSALACALVVSTCLTSRIALRRVEFSGPVLSERATARAEGPSRLAAHVGLESPELGPRFRSVLVLFSVASLASAAFTTTVVPALVERELSVTTAALLGGLMGLMQLPGRALLMNGALATPPSRLLVMSLAVQAVGFAALVVARTPVPIGAGIALVALGAGLMTLIRPHLVQTVFNLEHAGYLNGLLARSQQLARAVGPVLAVGLASVVGYGAVFGVLASVMAVLAVAWHVFVDV